MVLPPHAAARMSRYNSLILMKFQTEIKIRQCNHFPYASITYGPRPQLVHKVIHRNAG